MIKKSCWLFIVCLLFVAGEVCAQVRVLKGRVFEFQSRHPVAGITVYNLKTRNIVNTDTGGHFDIAAARGDLITFSGMGYKTDTVLVTDLRVKDYYLQFFIDFNPKYLFC